MTYIVTNATKYIMLFCMMIITIDGFRVLRRRKPEIREWFYHKTNLFVFLMHFMAYVTLFLHDKSWEIPVFYLGQVMFFFLYRILFRLFYKNCSLLILNLIYTFCVIGCIMLTRLNFEKALKQFTIMCVAAAISLIIPRFVRMLTFAKVFAGICGVVGLALLALVWVLGNTSYGANLSLNIKGISFQPSEFVKVTYVLLIAMLFRKRHDFNRVLFVSLIAAGHVGILVLSNDLGGALIYFITYLLMLYVATKTPSYALAGLAAGACASVAAYFLFSHVRVRVIAWMDPWSVIDKEGYQITQSLFAILSGGFTGAGLYQGLPNKIPVVEKDFMFSAIAEELGGLFAICLILLCLCLFLHMVIISTRMELIFYKLVGIGLASLYGVQVFLTIGGVMKMIPSTGVTLPLVSYGGSSMLSTFIILAIMQGLYQIEEGEGHEEEGEDAANHRAVSQGSGE